MLVEVSTDVIATAAKLASRESPQVKRTDKTFVCRLSKVPRQHQSCKVILIVHSEDPAGWHPRNEVGEVVNHGILQHLMQHPWELELAATVRFWTVLDDVIDQLSSASLLFAYLRFSEICLLCWCLGFLHLVLLLVALAGLRNALFDVLSAGAAFRLVSVFLNVSIRVIRSRLCGLSFLLLVEIALAFLRLVRSTCIHDCLSCSLSLSLFVW
mmetsp:Transcript_270/g.585  ORF Transcript_270/g.585 Transcript_270/m.585 type:complete len:212 (-) Transcript_270:52-687(-)